MKMSTWFPRFILVVLVPSGFAQDAVWKYPCPTNEIARYTAYRVTEEPRIDGVLDERVWHEAPTSPRFVDIVTGQPALRDTHAMVVWEDAYEPRGFAGAGEFARSRLKPFNGVGFNNHPRGGRLGQFAWTFPGKQTAVHIEGTLNDSRDSDRGWTVELAFPWTGCQWLATDGRAVPPHHGDVWRMDFSRFNTYKAPAPAQDSGGWVWTRHGVWDSHIPECFVFVTFSTNSAVSPRAAWSPK